LIITVGILAEIIIPQIGYIISPGVIWDFTLGLGVILLFGFAFGAMWVIGLFLQLLFGAVSDDTGSIRHDSRWSSPRTDDCWGSCESPTERYLREQIERRFNESIREAQERQRQDREDEEKRREREREMWEEMRREHEG